MIETIVNMDLQLTSHICTGKVTFDDLLEEIESFFRGDQTACNIWDFSDADMTSIEPDQIKGIAEFAKSCAPEKNGGRTALVTERDHNYAYSRMYEVFAEMAGISSETRVFRSITDALDWICDFVSNE